MSADQLQQTSQKISNHSAAKLKARLIRGDITDEKLFDQAFGAAPFTVSVMCRMTRWLSEEDRAKALTNLMNVTNEQIILTARTNGKHPYPLEVIEETAAAGGWGTVKAIPIPSDEHYNVVVLEKKK